MEFTPFKTSIITLAVIALGAFTGIGALLLFGNFHHDIQLLLAGAMGGAGVAFVGLATAVATPDPYNAAKGLIKYLTHRDDLDHEYNLKMLDKE